MIGKREEREEVSNPTPSPTVGLMFPPQFDPLSCPTTCACFLCEPVLPLALMHKESKKRGKDSPKRPLVLNARAFGRTASPACGIPSLPSYPAKGEG